MMSGSLRESQVTSECLSGDPLPEDSTVDQQPIDTVLCGHDDPVTAISKGLRPFFRQIEQLNVSQLAKKLESLNLHSTGNRDILLKRLKRYYERKKLAQCNLLQKVVYSPYYVVIDFEATCLRDNPPAYPHEIIEFPAVLVSSKTRSIVDTFQAYVRPEVNPRLSPFCTSLTGITQDIVDAANTFPDVLDQFQKWLISHGLSKKKMYQIVTDGPWDMAQFLHGQCVLSNIPYPQYAKRWINLRKAFRKYYRCKTCNLSSMLGVLGLTFEGRPHCGRDDATNIARVLINLVDDFASIEVNEKLDTGRQRHRERALLKAAIGIVEKREDPDAIALLQGLKSALADRTRPKPSITFDYSNSDYDDEDDDREASGGKPGDDDSNIRPKFLPVTAQTNDDSEGELADLKSEEDQAPGEYSDFASRNMFCVLSSQTTDKTD